ncbi:hypothetical protein ACJJTC_019579 [Scirpophaga incertulas]
MQCPCNENYRQIKNIRISNEKYTNYNSQQTGQSKNNINRDGNECQIEYKKEDTTALLSKTNLNDIRCLRCRYIVEKTSTSRYFHNLLLTKKVPSTQLCSHCYEAISIENKKRVTGFVKIKNNKLLSNNKEQENARRKLTTRFSNVSLTRYGYMNVTPPYIITNQKPTITNIAGVFEKKLSGSDTYNSSDPYIRDKTQSVTPRDLLDELSNSFIVLNKLPPAIDVRITKTKKIHNLPHKKKMTSLKSRRRNIDSCEENNSAAKIDKTINSSFILNNIPKTDRLFSVSKLIETKMIKNFTYIFYKEELNNLSLHNYNISSSELIKNINEMIPLKSGLRRINFNELQNSDCNVSARDFLKNDTDVAIKKKEIYSSEIKFYRNMRAEHKISLAKMKSPSCINTYEPRKRNLSEKFNENAVEIQQKDMTTQDKTDSNDIKNKSDVFLKKSIENNEADKIVSEKGKTENNNKNISLVTARNNTNNLKLVKNNETIKTVSDKRNAQNNNKVSLITGINSTINPKSIKNNEATKTVSDERKTKINNNKASLMTGINSTINSKYHNTNNLKKYENAFSASKNKSLSKQTEIYKDRNKPDIKHAEKETKEYNKNMADDEMKTEIEKQLEKHVHQNKLIQTRDKPLKKDIDHSSRLTHRFANNALTMNPLNVNKIYKPYRSEMVTPDSSNELDIDFFDERQVIGNKISELIIGQKVVKYQPATLKMDKDKKLFPKSEYKEELVKTCTIDNMMAIDEDDNGENIALTKKPRQTTEQEMQRRVIRYALSDRSFIEKGWTLLPTEKIVRKVI